MGSSVYKQIVSPNLSTETGAGWCLKFVQDSFRAPRMYNSATQAANSTKSRNSSRYMPSVAVPVWFDHWGTYQGVYDNWGHVVVWVPGRGFLSSPGIGYGQLWLGSIGAVEKTFNAKYRFWSLDINTLTVAEPVNVPTPDTGQEEDEEDMNVGMYRKDGATYHVVIGNYSSGFKLEYQTGSGEYNNDKAAQFRTGSFTLEDASVIKKFTDALDAIRQGK